MTQTKIILAVVVLAAAGGLWFILQGGSDTESPQAVQQDGASTEVDETSEMFEGVGSFTSLMGLGKNITCEFSYSDEEGSGSGVSYFAGEHMRVDSTQTFDGKTTVGHMINDGAFVYSWTEDAGTQYAIKMPVPDVTDVSAAQHTDVSSESEQQMIESDQEVTYNCDRWDVDPSLFMPPNDIEFMDMGTMFEEMMENMPEGVTLPEGFDMPAGVPQRQ